MIHQYRNAVVCRLLNRRIVISKQPELIMLLCFRLQQVKNEEQIEIIKKANNYIRVFKLRNITLVYSINNIYFFPDMFELISQTYIPLQQIDYYSLIKKH